MIGQRGLQGATACRPGILLDGGRSVSPGDHTAALLVLDAFGLLDGVNADEHLQVDCPEEIGNLSEVIGVFCKARQVIGEPQGFLE